ncbi:MAG: hypothetical protein UIT70_00010 [Clostridia bacterium]|nr:hypothetical protein [Clostridia bacterium]
MKAVDNAGNEVITATISKMTYKLISDLKAGEYVNYIDKNGTTIKCIALYDTQYNKTHGTNYGVQIISADMVDTVTLGNSDFNTSKDSYNNAIKTLNTKAQQYLNTTYASGARCVGSVPNNPSAEASNYFTSSYSYMSSYNGMLKNADTNYETDWNQMETLNIDETGYNYWLASRSIYSSYGTTDASMRSAGTGRDCRMSRVAFG